MRALPSSPTSALTVRGLRIERGGRTILDGASLDVPPGAVTALLGDSGAGKTSLLRCLVGLDAPAAGTVAFEGADIHELDACALRRRVALVPQTPVMFEGDVRANLAYGLDAPGEEELRAALAVAGLEEAFLERDARALSVGQSARVAIARALTRGPSVLLFDEPTASLDSAAAAGIEALVHGLAARGKAVLVVTHDHDQAGRIATRFARIDQGRLEA